jgi:hypothetical protein
MKMNVYLAAAALTLFCSAAIGAESYCDDPDAVAQWNAMADKYAGSHDWQRLHALGWGCARRSARVASSTIGAWIYSRPSGAIRFADRSENARYVPLSQLVGVDVDEHTREAIENWRY